MSNYISVAPAYGRDYKSQKTVRADWDANKDFVITDYGPNSGRYINKQDADNAGITVIVRYNKQTRTVSI